VCSFANAFAKAATAAVTPSPYGHGATLEGLIGDTTYLIPTTTTPKALAREMVESFDHEAASAGPDPLDDDPGTGSVSVDHRGVD
jgi:cell division protein YceG involved in septum cleavage